MVRKKLQAWLPVLFALVMIGGMVIGYKLKEKTLGNRFFSLSKRSSFQELLELIKGRYVDKVAADSISEVAAEELLSKLDPHSIYIPASKLDDINEELMGNYQGIGIEFQVISDTVHVTNVMKDGPSEKAGLMIGDRLIGVNDSINLAGKNLTTDIIRQSLRGTANTSVHVQLLRNGQKKNITITRGHIPVFSVDAAYLIAPKTGYLRINKFGERTYEEFMQAMEKLKGQGMEQLIVDLRGNGGGLMKEAADIADEFLSEEKLIVYTEGANVPKMEYRCKRDGIFEKGKLQVLIDETSASASEVLAGALQDWDRATIIGRRSFGKGLVQQQFHLSDGSAVRLTVARYFSPLGRNIQKPYSKGKTVYQAELSTRWHNGELIKEDTSKPIGKAYKTPAGHTVYGGGGITPDVFVPTDTVHMDRALGQMYYKNMMAAFVYNYYIQNRSWFNSMKSPAELVAQFKPGEKEWQGLSNYAAKDTIQLSKVNYHDKAGALRRMQALMARQIWRAAGYFEVANLSDSAVLKAVAGMK